jgi:RHS repeat-associated protein
VYDPAGNLRQLIDPNWNYTQWQHDNRNRVAKKIYADGSAYLYDYDGAGNLLHQTDAKGVLTTYGYDVVNNLTSIAAPGLAAIGFTYDSLNRRTQMTDGTGTTTFGYDLASQLTTVDGPLANDTISLSYDALGRMTGRSVNNAGAATLVYDDYRRPQTATNPLGTFTYNYPDPVSTLLSSITATSGPTTSFSYLDAGHDQRLGEIWHKDSGNQTISKFDYEYNVLGAITRWTQQTDANPPQHYNFDYDHVSQLRAATLRDASDGILKGYSYDYDPAGNRTVEAIDTLVNGETPNNLNQLTSQQGGTGMLPIRGTTNVPAWVFINGNYAPSKPDNTFEGRTAVTPGDNTVTVEAIDQNGNTTTNQYSVTVTGSGNKTLSYDPNGNLVSDGTRTFEWDSLNRLTAVTSGTHRSEFTYNGVSQRVKIVEKDNGNVTSTKQFVWVLGDARPCEERDGSNNVTKRFYPQGEQIGNTSYYYTKDHLGSVRELTDNSGAVQGRYDYDPYGRRTKVSGSIDADFGFTGHYYHQPSGLHLALYRAYDVDLGRWISRDPIGEIGGSGLYGYVTGNPLNAVDPLGLFYSSWGQLWFGDQSYDPFEDANTGNGGMSKRCDPGPTLGEATKEVGIGMLDLLANIGLVALIGPEGGAVDEGLAEEGTQLWRVFGDEAKGLSEWWSRVNPAEVSNYREAAGLWPQNSGQFVIEGTLSDTEGVILTRATSGPGGVGGGLPSAYVPNPSSQITITHVSGANPPF